MVLSQKLNRVYDVVNQGQSCVDDDSVVAIGCSGNNAVVCNLDNDDDPHWDFSESCDANSAKNLAQRICRDGGCKPLP